MIFDTKHQKFRGYPGDWNLIYAKGDEDHLYMIFESDAPENQTCIFADGLTGRGICRTDRAMADVWNW